MGGVGDKPRLDLILSVDALQHGIDGAGQSTQLLLSAGDLDAAGFQAGHIDAVHRLASRRRVSVSTRSPFKASAVSSSARMGANIC